MAVQPEQSAGATAPLAGNDLEASARDRPDRDRLREPVGLDRRGQLLELRRGEHGAVVAAGDELRQRERGDTVWELRDHGDRRSALTMTHRAQGCFFKPASSSVTGRPQSVIRPSVVMWRSASATRANLTCKSVSPAVLFNVNTV
jgi:hypothetical protein